MPKYLDVDGVGVVEFPDAAPDEFITETIRREYPNAKGVNLVEPVEQQQPKAPNTDQWVTTSAFLRGVDNLQSSLYGAGAAASQALGAENARDWFLAGYLRNIKEAEENPARIKDFTDIIAKDGGIAESISRGATYAIEGIFENLPTMGPALLAGPGAAILATAGKKAAMSAAGMTAEAIAANIAKRQVIAGTAGAYAANAAQEIGSITGEIYEKTGKVEPYIAGVYGGAAAGLETAADMIGVGKLMDVAERKFLAKMLGEGVAKEVSGRLATRVAKGAISQAGVEGITEGVQTAIEQAAVSHADPNTPFWTKENMVSIVDSVLKGGIAGGAFGAASGLKTPAREGGTTVADTQAPDSLATPGEDAGIPLQEDLTRADLERAALDLSKTAPLTAQAILDNLPASTPVEEAAPAAPVLPTVEEIKAVVGESPALAIVSEPDAEWNARSYFDPETKELTGIALNQAKLTSAKEAQDVFEHELSHGASETGAIDTVLETLAPEESRAIDQEIAALGYDPSVVEREKVARAVDTLRKTWSDRGWFQRAVGQILVLANKVGFRITRLSAEAIAIKAVAQARQKFASIPSAPAGVDASATGSLPTTAPGVVAPGAPPLTQTQNAPPEVPIQEGVRAESQNRVEARQTEETGVGDSLLGPTQSQEKIAPNEKETGIQRVQETRNEGAQGESQGQKEGMLQVGLSPEEITRDSRVVRPPEVASSWVDELNQRDYEDAKALEAQFGIPVYQPNYAKSGSPDQQYAWLGSMSITPEAYPSIESKMRGVQPEFRELYFHKGGKSESTAWGRSWWASKAKGRGFSFEGDVGGRTFGAWLEIRNPMRVSGEFYDVPKNLLDRAVRGGFDAIVGENEANGPVVYVVDPKIIHELKPAVRESRTNPTYQGTRDSRVTPTQDAQYLDAVERGDMETAQRMVDEAAKKAGYTERLFHGRRDRVNVLPAANGIFLSTKRVAGDYGTPLSQRFNPSSPDIRESRVNPTYQGTGETKPSETMKNVRKIRTLPPPQDYYTQSEKERLTAAKAFVDQFDDLAEAAILATRPDTYADSTRAMQPIILAEILKRNYAEGDATFIKDIVWESATQTASESGQNLQAWAQVRSMFDPDYQVQRTKLAWERGNANQIKNVVKPEPIRKAVKTAKKAAGKSVLSTIKESTNPKIKAGVKAGINWKEIFESHADDQDQTRRSLLAKLQADPKFQAMSPEDQLETVNAFGRLWETKRNAEIQKVFKRVTQAGGRDISKGTAKKILPEIVRLTNMGALDDESIWNAVAPKFGLPPWTPEHSAKLKAMIEAEQKLPEGSTQRNQAAQRRIQWLTKEKGYSNWDIAGEWWYASVLSGIRTQVSNATSAVNVATEAFLTAASNPRMAPYVWSAYFRGWGIGSRVFGDIALRGDYSHAIRGEVETKINKLALLKDDPSAFKRFLSSGRFVPQLMAAMDTVNASVSQEIRATQMAYYNANDEFKPGSPQFREAVQKTLGTTQAQIQAATEQAQAEIDAGQLSQDFLARRRDEILEGMRPSDLREASHQYGLLVTGNAEPTGIVGALYRGLLTVRKLAPVTTPIAPFLRFAANFTNIITDYLPPVALTRLFLHGPASKFSNTLAKAFNKDFQPMSTEDYQLLKAKAALGSSIIATGLAWAMRRGDGGDDEGFDIEGSWFKLTPQQKFQLKNEGRSPYSIRVGNVWISYRETPFVALLATIGNVRDAQKYTKSSKREQMNVFQDGLLRSLFTVKDMSMLAGLSDVLGIAADSTANDTAAANKVTKILTRSVGGFIPNIAKEVDNWFDTTLDKPMNFAEFMLKEVPVAHRLIGRPAINILGEPVQVPKYPWSRVTGSQTDDKVWAVLLEKAEQGAFLVAPDERSLLVLPGGKRAPMTQEQAYEFTKKVGRGYRELTERNLARIKAMNAKQAEDFFAGAQFDAVRARAKREVARQ